MSAESYRLRGNEHFGRGELAEAAAEYTKALALSPEVTVHWLNRALCYLKQEKWDLVLADCARVLALDPAAVRALYYQGCALIKLGRFADAITSLKAAIVLAQDAKLDYADELSKLVITAKKLKWQAEEQARLDKKSALHVYLDTLIRADQQRSLQALDPSGPDYDAARDAVDQAAETRIAELKQVFVQAETNHSRRDVPDYLFGNISFEILRDPVISPSGITYERSSVIEHLHRVGHFDPVTRIHMKESDLIPNLIMKEVIDDFIERNGWAADF